jgi:hypothetical protein
MSNAIAATDGYELSYSDIEFDAPGVVMLALIGTSLRTRTRTLESSNTASSMAMASTAGQMVSRARNTFKRGR